MKKNCHNCDYLEWIDDDSEVCNNSGYVCHQREYLSDDQEEKHLNQLENEKYRERAKICHVKRKEL